MDIKNPEYILEIARQQSVTRAAEKLFLTQSTLSQYLLKLESELEVPLFTRTKGSLIPTDAGRLYLQAAQAIVQIQETTFDSITSLRNDGCIKLGVTSMWGMQLATDILPRFKEHFPTITLKIYENRYHQLKAMLQTAKLDLALMAVADPQDLAAFPMTQLRQEELVLILPTMHPFCVATPHGRHIRPEELPLYLRECNFILSDEGSTIRSVQDSIFAKLFFHPQVICELNSNSTTLSMVAAGVGAAFVPANYTRNITNVRVFRFLPTLYRDNVLVQRKELEKTPALALLESCILAHPLFQ